MDQVLFLYTVYCLMALFVIYGPMLSSQNIYDELEKISFELYSLQWYMAEPEFKKILLFMLHRSQKIQFITVCNILRCNMETFTNVNYHK